MTSHRRLTPLYLSFALAFGCITVFPSAQAQTDKCANKSQRDSRCLLNQAGQYSNPTFANGPRTTTNPDGSTTIGLPKRGTAYSNAMGCDQTPNGTCSGRTETGGVPEVDKTPNACVTYGDPMYPLYPRMSDASYPTTMVGRMAGSGYLGLASNSTPTLGCEAPGTNLASGPYNQNPNCSMWVPSDYPYLLIGATFVKCDVAVPGVNGSLQCAYNQGTGYVKSTQNSPIGNKDLHGAIIACQNTTMGNHVKPWGENGVPINSYVPCSPTDTQCAAYSPPPPSEGL